MSVESASIPFGSCKRETVRGVDTVPSISLDKLKMLARVSRKYLPVVLQDSELNLKVRDSFFQNVLQACPESHVFYVIAVASSVA